MVAIGFAVAEGRATGGVGTVDSKVLGGTVRELVRQCVVAHGFVQRHDVVVRHEGLGVGTTGCVGLAQCSKGHGSLDSLR